MSDFVNSKNVKTRKPHKCGFCNSTIPAGQPADYNSGIYDDMWFNYYMCEFCKKYIEKFDPDLSDGFNEDYLGEDLNNLGLYLIDIDYVNKTIIYEDKDEKKIIQKWNDFFNEYSKKKEYN